MSKCPNCGTAMSCGCQKRVLPNGKAGCSKCIGKTPSVKQTGNAPTINNAEIEDKL